MQEVICLVSPKKLALRKTWTNIALAIIDFFTNIQSLKRV